MEAIGVVAGRMNIERWDLGSNPRSPKYLFHIFSKVIICRLLSVVQHTPQPSRRQVFTSNNPRANDGKLWYYLVNGHAANPRSQTRLALMSQKTAKFTSLLGPEPPLVQSFSFIFFFFYFVCLLVIFSNYYFLSLKLIN